MTFTTPPSPSYHHILPLPFHHLKPDIQLPKNKFCSALTPERLLLAPADAEGYGLGSDMGKHMYSFNCSFYWDGSTGMDLDPETERNGVDGEEKSQKRCSISLSSFCLFYVN